MMSSDTIVDGEDGACGSKSSEKSEYRFTQAILGDGGNDACGSKLSEKVVYEFTLRSIGDSRIVQLKVLRGNS